MTIPRHLPEKRFADYEKPDEDSGNTNGDHSPGRRPLSKPGHEFAEPLFNIPPVAVGELAAEDNGCYARNADPDSHNQHRE